MIEEVYIEDWLEILRSNLVEHLAGKVDENRIYKFEVPSELTDSELSPCIRINMSDFTPNNWAGDKVIGYHVGFLIDIWHEDYFEVFKLGQYVQQILRNMKFGQSSPLFEEDEDTELYRDSRTYSGNILIKTNNIQGE